MTGLTASPREIEQCAGRQSPSEKYHPLLHLLRMLLVEAYRYQKASSKDVNHERSIKALFHQVDFLWKQLQGEPLEKYEFIRSRLSLLLLWNHETDSNSFARSIMNPPIHMSTVFRNKRQVLLTALRPGELFVGALEN